MFITWKETRDFAALVAEIAKIDPSFDLPPCGGIDDFLAAAVRQAFTLRHLPLEVWRGSVKFEYAGGLLEIHRQGGGWYARLEVVDAVADQVATAIILGWDMYDHVAARAIPRACELLLASI